MQSKMNLLGFFSENKTKLMATEDSIFSRLSLMQHLIAFKLSDEVTEAEV